MRRIVRDDRDARPLQDGHATDPHGWLEEVHQEAKGEIAEQENLERVSELMRPCSDSRDNQRKHQEKRDFVQLCGVTGYAVAEVNSPWQTRGDTAGPVVETRQKTADASDRDARQQRHDEQITGG